MAPEQLAWDKNVRDCCNYPYENPDGRKPSKSVFWTYYSNKKSWGISSRDFYEKAFLFATEDGCIYKWSTSCKNHLERRPVPDKDTVRGASLMCAQKFWRDPTT